jgi:hypothetical protein
VAAGGGFGGGFGTRWQGRALPVQVVRS